MKVYTVRAYGRYGGGMAVVTADNELEALAVAGSIRDSTWHTDYKNDGEPKLLPIECEGPARVLDHFETGE